MSSATSRPTPTAKVRPGDRAVGSSGRLRVLENQVDCLRRQQKCLRELLALRDRTEDSLPSFFEGAVALIPRAWQYAESATARILYQGECFQSPGFSESNWVLAADLTLGSSLVGILEVRYSREFPPEAEGPFLTGERLLIDMLAQEISGHAARVTSFGAVQFSERRLFDIVNFLPDPTFAIDRSGRIIAWNRAMEQCSGMPAAQVMGKGDYLYALPYYGERRPILIDLVLDFDRSVAEQYPTLQADGDTLTAELYLPRSGKQGRHLSAKASPLYGPGGGVVGAIEITRDITDMKETQKALVEATHKLEAEQLILEEKNAALREVIRQVDVEKKQLAQQIQTNIDRVVKPMIRSLRGKADEVSAKSLSMVAEYLDDITAPFVDKLERAFQSLSPREMQICSMIRDGMSCKDIADALGISVNTVLNQRQRIRRKLQISKRKVNLRSFLKSL